MADATCSVEDCDRPVGRHGAQGYCGKHYQRWKKTGDPHAEPPGAERRPGVISPVADGSGELHRPLVITIGSLVNKVQFWNVAVGIFNRWKLGGKFLLPRIWFPNLLLG